jgi:hypothetical protein
LVDYLPENGLGDLLRRKVARAVSGRSGRGLHPMIYGVALREICGVDEGAVMRIGSWKSRL